MLDSSLYDECLLLCMYCYLKSICHQWGSPMPTGQLVLQPRCCCLKISFPRPLLALAATDLLSPEMGTPRLACRTFSRALPQTFPLRKQGKPVSSGNSWIRSRCHSSLCCSSSEKHQIRAVGLRPLDMGSKLTLRSLLSATTNSAKADKCSRLWPWTWKGPVVSTVFFLVSFFFSFYIFYCFLSPLSHCYLCSFSCKLTCLVLI